MTTAVAAACIMVVPITTATADPGFGSASDAQAKLAELSRESEQTNESLHNAQIDLDARAREQLDAQTAVDASRAALDAAQSQLVQLKPAMDKVANVNYQGARTNRLFAVMVSDSPQQLLDQMSALDVISAETAGQVAQFQQARSEDSMNLYGTADDCLSELVDLCVSVSLWRIHFPISRYRASAACRVSAGTRGNVPTTCSNSDAVN